MALLTRHNTNPGDPPYVSCPKGKGHFGPHVTALVDKLWSDDDMRRKIQEWFAMASCPKGHRLDCAQPGKEEGKEGYAYGVCAKWGCGSTVTTWEPPKWFKDALVTARQADDEAKTSRIKTQTAKTEAIPSHDGLNTVISGPPRASASVVSRDEFLTSSFEVLQQLAMQHPSAGSDNGADEYDKYLDDGEDEFYLSVPMPSSTQQPALVVGPVAGAGDDFPTTEDVVAHEENIVLEDGKADFAAGNSQATTLNMDDLPPSSQLPSTSFDDQEEEQDAEDSDASHSDSDGMSKLPALPFGEEWKYVRYDCKTGKVYRVSASAPPSTPTKRDSLSTPPSTPTKTRSSLSQAVQKKGRLATLGKDKRIIRFCLFTSGQGSPKILYATIKKERMALAMTDQIYNALDLKSNQVLLWYNRRMNGFEEYTGGNLLRAGQEHCIILRLAELEEPGLLSIGEELALMESGMELDVEE